jgi:hypothetical protein
MDSTSRGREFHHHDAYFKVRIPEVKIYAISKHYWANIVTNSRNYSNHQKKIKKMLNSE